MNEINNYEQIKDIINQEKIICLYFSTDTCNVCKVLRPKIGDLIEQFNNAESYYINTDKIEQVKGEYMIFAVPVIALFYNGKELTRFNRFVTINEIKEYIEKFQSFIMGDGA